MAPPPATLTISIPPDFRDQLMAFKAEAKARNHTISRLIRAFIAAYLEDPA